MSHLLMNAGRKWISDPKIILDLGARDCSESVMFAHDYPSSRVIAFECNPTSIPICRRRISAHANITLVPLAVHERNGLTDFYAVHRRPPPGFSPNTGASSLFLASGHMAIDPIHQIRCTVECTRLDTWAARNCVDVADVVWLDLQGAELLALKGMGELVKTVRVLHTEVTYKELYKGQVMYHELHEWLLGRGFARTYHQPAVTVPDWFGEAVYVRRDLLAREPQQEA